jgi:hypothetical protein
MASRMSQQSVPSVMLGEMCRQTIRSLSDTEGTRTESRTKPWKSSGRDVGNGRLRRLVKYVKCRGYSEREEREKKSPRDVRAGKCEGEHLMGKAKSKPEKQGISTHERPGTRGLRPGKATLGSKTSQRNQGLRNWASGATAKCGRKGGVNLAKPG